MVFLPNLRTRMQIRCASQKLEFLYFKILPKSKMFKLDMILETLRLHPSAIIQWVTFWAFYKWFCRFGWFFYDCFWLTIVRSALGTVKQPPFACNFMVWFIPDQIFRFIITSFTSSQIRSREGLLSNAFDNIGEFLQTTGLL